MPIPAEAEEGIPMLVDPAMTDGLEVLDVVYDLRDLYRIAPSPAAASRNEDEDEEDQESGDDDTDDSDDDSEKDSEESDDEDDDDEDDKAKTAQLIKQLREENKARRLKLRETNKELERIKAENARLKRLKGKFAKREEPEEDDEDDTDPKALTEREKQVEIKDNLLDVMSELDINKKNKRLILALIDEDDVDFEVSDTGRVKVSGLKEAVEELLEDYPEWQNRSDDDDEESGSTRRIASGNRKKKGSNGLDKATLAKKYPALATR
jgi:hypothetical protein